MYRTHTFDYITEALCFLNENNIDKDNIITLTNGGVHWLLVWYEPEQANEETERKFYNVMMLKRQPGDDARIIAQAIQIANEFEYDSPVIEIKDTYVKYHFFNSPTKTSIQGYYAIEDQIDINSFYNYLKSVVEHPNDMDCGYSGGC